MTMGNITLSPARRSAILQGIRPRRGRRLHWTVGRAVLAAVLAVLLTFSAFAAAIPALREALLGALGSFAEQSQSITGIATEDNGIEVRPVAALSDSGMTKVYIEIQDKTGSRLDGSYDVGVEIAHPLDDAPVHLGTSSRQIRYDAESHTALYEARRPDSIAAENPTAAVRVFLLDPQAAPGEETIGDWSFEIDLERVAERRFTPDATINGYRLFEVRISPISLTMAEPTIAPSEIPAIFAACSGVEMPNPMAHGTSVFSRTVSTIDSRSVLISLRIPVTPRLETIYRNPSASRAIMAILSSDVGAIREIRSTPYFRQAGRNSSFSSYGTSGRISPSIPISRQVEMNCSVPYEKTTFA